MIHKIWIDEKHHGASIESTYTHPLDKERKVMIGGCKFSTDVIITVQKSDGVGACMIMPLEELKSAIAMLEKFHKLIE